MHYDTSAENSRVFFGRFLDVHVKSKSPCKLRFSLVLQRAGAPAGF
jgi:hypothetical protein